MAGGSTSTQTIPSNTLANADGESFTSAGNAREIVGVGTETRDIAIIANPNNSGLIYIGFSETIDTNTAFPLEAGTAITMSLDANQVPVYAAADTVGDDVRWIALG